VAGQEPDAAVGVAAAEIAVGQSNAADERAPNSTRKPAVKWSAPSASYAAVSPSLFHSTFPIRVDRTISNLLQPLISRMVFVTRGAREGCIHGLSQIRCMQLREIGMSSFA